MKIGSLFFVALAAIALPASAQAQKSQDWTRCENKGKEFSPDIAIGACTAVIQSGTENEKNLALAFSKRGTGYNDKRQYDQAIENFNEAIRLDPENAASFTWRGFAYGGKRHFDRGIEDLNQAIRLDPKNVLAFFIRGNAHNLKGENDRAIDDFTQAIGLDPKLALAFVNRGRTYIAKGEALYDRAMANGNDQNDRATAKGQFDRAIEDYSEAIRLEPKNATAFQGRGYAYFLKGEAVPAIENYSEAIKLDPKDATKWSFRCVMRKAINRDLPEALEDCNESLRLNPNDSKTLDTRGQIHIKLGRFAQAVDDYTAVLSRNPRSASALYGRGYAKRQNGDARGAESDIAAATAIQADIAERYAGSGLK